VLVDGPARLSPSEHPKKEVREALERIVASGDWFIVEMGHWGQLRCTRPCKCRVRVDKTPQNPSSHARRVERETKWCPVDDGDPRRKSRDAKT
jgi:hypothetical protein